MGTPIFLTSALFVLAAMTPELATDPSSVSASVSDEPLSAMSSYREPSIAWKTADEAMPDEAICRDRIHQARERMGQPPLQREPATGEEPVLIWAVDRRENGCAVLVAKGDPEDIRPIPKVEEYYGLRPAN